jgi:putative ABC transport system permease protein
MPARSAIQDRTPEIAIRMSLGADASAMRNMILREGLRLAVVGIVIGAASSWALARVMTTFIFGVKVHDPLVITAAPLVLGAVGLFALWRPALRATRIRPADILRSPSARWFHIGLPSFAQMNMLTSYTSKL